MASIPLPALDLKPPPAPPDQLAQYGRLMQLRQMQQEQPVRQQILQQQAQAGQIGLQQAQQAQQDQQSFRTAMQDPSLKGKTIGEVADALAQKGQISQTGWIAAKKADLDQRTSLATLDEKQLANAKAAHDLTQTLYNNVMDMPDDQLAANWPSIAQQYNAIPGNNKQSLNPNQPLTKQQLTQFGPMLSLNNAYLDQELERRKATTAQQTAEADLALKQQNLLYGPSGPAAEAKYRFILSKKASGQVLSPDDINFAKGFEASRAKSTSQSDSLGVVSNNFSKPSGLATVGGVRAGSPASSVPPRTNGLPAGGNAPPSAGQIKNDVIDMIGQYRMDPTLLGRTLYRHPEMLGLIQAKYPDWDQTQYQAKNKIVQSYTSGPESRSINAIGTALGHANELRDAIDALGNGNMGINTLRQIGNSIGVQVGDDKVTAFNLIVHRLAPEITAAYVQGGGGEGERAAAAEDFNPSLSRQQLLSNWGETVKLLQSKIAQQEQQWNTTYHPSQPQDQFATRFLSAPARQAIQRWSNETGGQPAVGATKTFPNGKTGKWDGTGWVAQ